MTSCPGAELLWFDSVNRVQGWRPTAEESTKMTLRFRSEGAPTRRPFANLIHDDSCRHGVDADSRHGEAGVVEEFVEENRGICDCIPAEDRVRILEDAADYLREQQEG